MITLETLGQPMGVFYVGTQAIEYDKTTVDCMTRRRKVEYFKQYIKTKVTYDKCLDDALRTIF